MKQIEMIDAYRDRLFQIPLFRDLPLNIKHNILESLDYKIYEISKNEIILRQNSYCEHLYVLIEGKLKVDIIDGLGNEVMIEHIIAPRAFATPHLFKTDTTLPATFKSIENGIFFTASKNSVFTLISKYPDLLKNFLCVSGNCDKCTTLRLRALSYKNIRSRFVAYLFEQKQYGSDVIIIDHNQVQLADYLCVTRPALTREINKMIKEDLIYMNGKRIELINVNELKRILL